MQQRVIVTLSQKDPGLTRDIYTYAQTQDEYPENLDRLAFLPFHRLKTATARVTMMGHSDMVRYGDDELDPLAFFNKLKECDFPFEKVKHIDLFGCEAGLIKDKQSYAMQFAEILYANGYGHIEVRAFNNTVTNKPLHSMRLQINHRTGAMRVHGIPEEKKAEFEKIDKPLQEHLKVIDKELVGSLLSLFHLLNIKKIASASRDEIQELSAEIQKLQTQLESKSLQHAVQAVGEIKELQDAQQYFNVRMQNAIIIFRNVQAGLQVQLSPETKEKSRDISEVFAEARESIINERNFIQRKSNKFSEKIHGTFSEEYMQAKDLRRALDSYDNFLIKQDWLPKLKQFDHEHWMVWKIVNERIHDKTEKYRGAWFFSSKRLPGLTMARDQFIKSDAPLAEKIDQLIQTRVFKPDQITKLTAIKNAYKRSAEIITVAPTVERKA